MIIIHLFIIYFCASQITGFFKCRVYRLKIFMQENDGLVYRAYLVKQAHLSFQLSQLTLQLRYLGLQLLFSALPPLFTLCHCSVHLYPELCSETILAFYPAVANQKKTDLKYLAKWELFNILSSYNHFPQSLFAPNSEWCHRKEFAIYFFFLLLFCCTGMLCTV